LLDDLLRIGSKRALPPALDRWAVGFFSGATILSVLKQDYKFCERTHEKFSSNGSAQRSFSATANRFWDIRVTPAGDPEILETLIGPYSQANALVPAASCRSRAVRGRKPEENPDGSGPSKKETTCRNETHEQVYQKSLRDISSPFPSGFL
jgi:hypothetical protein